MVDINAETEKALSVLPYTVCYYYPDNFNKLPVVSFYNLTERGAFSCDDEEAIQRGWVQIDVWADKPSDCGTIAIEVCNVMMGSGWYREMSMDVPKSDGVYHRTMRFVKDFISE